MFCVRILPLLFLSANWQCSDTATILANEGYYTLAFRIPHPLSRPVIYMTLALKMMYFLQLAVNIYLN
jgi:hypothetical protein